MHKPHTALAGVVWLSGLGVKLTRKHPDLLLTSSSCGPMIKATQVLDTLFHVCSRCIVFALSLNSRGAIISVLALSALIKFLCYVACLLYASMLDTPSEPVTLSPLHLTPQHHMDVKQRERHRPRAHSAVRTISSPSVNRVHLDFRVEELIFNRGLP